MGKITVGSFIDEPNELASDSGGESSGSPEQAGSVGGKSDPELINGFESIDPTTGSATGGSGSGGGGSATGRRRGRPPGSRNAATGGSAQTKKTGNLGGGFELLLISLHQMGAAFIAPELELAGDEAKLLSDAIARVNAQYEHTISPKMLAWMNLGAVAAGIYGTRAYAIHHRMKKETKKGPAPVIDIKRTPPPAPAPAPRSPSDLFGLDFGGSIPDAV